MQTFCQILIVAFLVLEFVMLLYRDFSKNPHQGPRDAAIAAFVTIFLIGFAFVVLLGAGAFSQLI